MTSKGPWPLLLALAAGCSIEGTRQVGETCLQDRECAAPLRCEVTSAGRSYCVDAVRLDAGPVQVTTPPQDAGAALDAVVDGGG